MELKYPTIQVLIGQEYSDFLLTAIQKAQKSVSILMFDWRWYPLDPSCPVQLINQALLAAKKRGVKVRCLFDTGESLKYFQELGLDVKRYQGHGLLHAKLILLDDYFVILGSHNMTNNALNYNYETSVAIVDDPTYKRFSDFFEQLWR